MITKISHQQAVKRWVEKHRQASCGTSYLNDKRLCTATYSNAQPEEIFLWVSTAASHGGSLQSHAPQSTCEPPERILITWRRAPSRQATRRLREINENVNGNRCNTVWMRWGGTWEDSTGCFFDHLVVSMSWGTSSIGCGHKLGVPEVVRYGQSFSRTPWQSGISTYWALKERRI